MCSDDVAISVRNLTKTYRIFGHPGDRIKQAATFGLRKYHREFTALKDVSFDIKKGETVGIIGRNGSGKSTLLQLICGILKPTSGTVKVNGRVSALLELGAGFNPEFTGRENVYFQGALMGFSKTEMDSRFDDIAAFADIGEFIDQPVRTYSSGMFVRLAFAAAVHVEPDILVVDEALGVGDAEYQPRAYERMRQLMERKITIVIVTHDVQLPKPLCHYVIHMDHGRMARRGVTGEVCDDYIKEQLLVSSFSSMRGTAAMHARAQTKLRLESAETFDIDGYLTSRFLFGDWVLLRIRFTVLDTLAATTLAFYFKDRSRIDILGTNTYYEGVPLRQLVEATTYILEFQFRNPLRGGAYTISALAVDSIEPDAQYFDWRDDLASFESVDPPGAHRWAAVSPFPQVKLRIETPEAPTKSGREG